MQSLALGLLVVAGVLLAASVASLIAARRRLSAELRLFADFMEQGPFLAYAKDGEGRYVYENQALKELTARLRPGSTSLLGLTDREAFSTSESAAYTSHDQDVIKHGRPMQFEETSADPDGTVRHWSSVKFPRTDALGRPGIAGVTIEVTDLIRARSAAQSSEDRCRLALDAGQMGAMALDLETLMLTTSPMFAILHGNPETTTHISLVDAMNLVHPDDRGMVSEALQIAVGKAEPHRILYRVIKPDGSIAWIKLIGNVCRDDAGRPTVVRAVGFDFTDRQLDFEELARNRDMLRRLIDVQENERQTLCHELHDGLIQYVIAAKMQLESARDDDNAASRKDRIDAALECLLRGIAEGRQVIRGVRTAVLDDLGLAAAIEDLVEQLATASVRVAISLDDHLDALSPALQTTVFRLVQESLANVRKHSGAEHAEVDVHRLGDDICVRVRDAGCGFDVDECRKHGFGLTGMMERVRLAGGTFRVESRPGAGTEIVALLPIAAGADHAESASRPADYAAAVSGFLPR